MRPPERKQEARNPRSRRRTFVFEEQISVVSRAPTVAAVVDRGSPSPTGSATVRQSTMTAAHGLVYHRAPPCSEATRLGSSAAWRVGAVSAALNMRRGGRRGAFRAVHGVECREATRSSRWRRSLPSRVSSSRRHWIRSSARRWAKRRLSCRRERVQAPKRRRPQVGRRQQRTAHVCECEALHIFSRFWQDAGSSL